MRTCPHPDHPSSSGAALWGPNSKQGGHQTLLLISLVFYPQETLRSPGQPCSTSVASSFPKRKAFLKPGAPPLSPHPSPIILYCLIDLISTQMFQFVLFMYVCVCVCVCVHTYCVFIYMYIYTYFDIFISSLITFSRKVNPHYLVYCF